MAIELKIPEVGESITEVEIGKWHKSEGETARKDEVLVEIETDKATQELPAPATGRLSRVLKKQGETAHVGDVIAIFEEGEAAPAPAGGAPAKEKGKEKEKPAPAAAAEPHVMPAARRLLEEHGLRAQDVQATGPGGRLLKEDVQRHIERAQPEPPPAEQAPPAEPTLSREETPTPAAAAAPAPSAIGERQEEVVPMTPLRRRIAQRLVQAQQAAAMLTTFNEADMSAVMALRNQYKDAFEKRYGIKLGFMSFFVKASIDALKQFPAINAEVRDTNIVYKNYFDIGIAVSTERGLVVPVLRDADRLSFAQIELAIADFARRARDNKIKLEELQGGTFTITNGGVFGSLLSTPILNPPQSGVLGMHAIQDRPVAVGGEVKIRPMMYLALTYDHRIVDGREAVTFLRRIKEAIEDPSRMLLEI